MSRNAYSFVARTLSLLFGLSIALPVNLTTPYAARATGVLYVAPSAAGSGDCSSWENACILQTAQANAVSGVEIWVMQGVHTPGAARTDTFTLKNGVALYGGFAGTETGLDERDWTTYITVLSGDIDQNDVNTDGNFIAETSADIQGANTYHVVTGGLTNNTAVLDGFVITAGQANGASPHEDGGGMYNQDASPRLTNLIFSGNTGGGGGGMFNWNSHPLLTDVTFRGNTATSGGGMYNTHYSTPTLIQVTFDGNGATNGGGMVNGGDHTSPVLRGVIFRDNTAGNSGGGMYNSQYNSDGGLLTDVIFSGNTAVDGGGMFNSNISPTVINAIFVNNTASYGGGVHNYLSAVELINVTFSGNTASYQGGAMYSWWGGGPGLKNSIVWGNSAPNGPGIYNGPAGNTLISYSDLQGCGGSGAGWNSACGTDSGGNIEADPLFVDAANGNLRLQLTSPAIDAGNNVAVPTGITTDLVGSPRFTDIATVPDTGNGTPPIVDMGAFEKDLTSPSVVSITLLDPNPTSAASVRFAVTFSEAVIGVEMADFSLYTTGSVTGASVTEVSGSGAVFTVTVSTGTGSGTLRLDVPASAGITDLAGNPLAGLPFTGGEVYDVDKTAPTVVSITRLDPNPTNAATIRFTVTFSEAVTGVDGVDFSLYTTGGVTGASVTDVSGSGAIYTVTVSTGTGGGTLRLDVPTTLTITDLAGNPLSGLPYADGQAYTILYNIFLPIISKNGT